jgi:hypothetical protein
VVLFIGYVCTYTIQWPLTPLVCYANNNLELRSDLLKLNNAFRRPLPRKTKGVGAWEACIAFSTWASIPVVVSFATISARTAEVFFLVRARPPARRAHARAWTVAASAPPAAPPAASRPTDRSSRAPPAAPSATRRPRSRGT